jgi:hypothetical protein
MRRFGHDWRPWLEVSRKDGSTSLASIRRNRRPSPIGFSPRSALPHVQTCAIIASDGSPTGFRSGREAQPTADDDYDHRERRPPLHEAAQQGRRQGELK